MAIERDGHSKEYACSLTTGAFTESADCHTAEQKGYHDLSLTTVTTSRYAYFPSASEKQDCSLATCTTTDYASCLSLSEQDSTTDSEGWRSASEQQDCSLATGSAGCLSASEQQDCSLTTGTTTECTGYSQSEQQDHCYLTTGTTTECVSYSSEQQDCSLTTGTTTEHDSHGKEHACSLASRSLALAECDSKKHACSVCLELFKEPKILPCCHTFCLECLEKAVQIKGEIACPQCRKTHQIPVGGLTALLTDFIATYEVEVVGLKNSNSQNTPVCDECEQPGPIRYYCGDCQSYQCDECGPQLHKRFKSFRGHKMIPIEEMNAATLQSHQKQYCAVHKGETLKLYCETCSELICSDYTLVKHRQHDFKFLQDARKEIDAEMASLTSNVAKELTVFKRHLQEINKVEVSVTGHLEVLKADINAFFDKLASSIEKRRNVLLQQAEADCQKDLKQIWADKSFHEMTIAHTSSVFGLADIARKCTSDSEMILTALHSIAELRKLKETKWNSLAFTKVVSCTPKFTAGKNVAVDAVGKISSTDTPVTDIELLNPPKKVDLGETASFKVKVSTSLIDGRSGEPVYLQKNTSTNLKVVVHWSVYKAT